MYKLLFIITFISCFISSEANNNIDSLLNLLNIYHQDTAKVSTLCEIASLLIREKNPDAGKYAAQALEKSKSIVEPEYFNQSISLYLKTLKAEQPPEQQLQFLDKYISNINTLDYAKMSIIFLNKGLIYDNIDSSLNALLMFDKASQLAEQSKDTLTLIDVYTTKGIFYKKNSKYTLALESLITALKLSEYSGNLDGFFPICINLGTIYEQMLDYDNAFELYKKAEKVIDKDKDQNALAIINYKIGKMVLREFKYVEAEKYLKIVYEIHEQRNDKNGLIVSAAALSGIYYELKQYEEFLKWLKISMENAEVTQNQQGLASDYSAYGKYYEEVEHNYPKALEYYKKNLELDLNKVQLSHMYIVYRQLYMIYEKLGDFKNAFKYYNLYSAINDSLYNSENIKKQTELKLDYEYDKVQHQKDIENQIKEHEQKLLLEKERQRRNFFILVGVLASILLLLSFRSYRIKKKANILLAKQKQQIEEKNEELNQQNAEIAAQRDYLGVVNNELELKNKEIAEQKNKIEIFHNELKDSIQYAKQIQEAVLPSKEFIDSILTEYFIIFKPRDIVSGDFYWINKIENWIVIAVADCTGHGVPGAFMSMLGISLMNEIKIIDEKINAANALNELRTKMIKALKQRGISGEQKDGMDMSLLAIDSNTNNAQWAGANNPIWIVSSSKFEVSSSTENKQTVLTNLKQETSNHKLFELKPDKMPIAIYEKIDNFTNHEISLQKGDIIYLASDGYADQFGGLKGKKFLSKKFKKLLIENCSKSMFDQKKIIEATFVEWKNKNEQTDDITIVGIKI